MKKRYNLFKLLLIKQLNLRLKRKSIETNLQILINYLRKLQNNHEKSKNYQKSRKQ